MLRTVRLIIVAALLLLASASSGIAVAQPAEESLDSGDSADSTLQGPEWKKTLRDFDTWASIQKLYEAKQVKEFRAKIVDKAATLLGSDRDAFREDLNDRLHVLLSDEARAARKWLGENLAVASDSYAAEIKKKYQGVATMNASQLDDELAEFDARRGSFKQYRQGLDATRKLEVEAARDRERRQEAANRAARASAPSSSYHPGYNYNSNSNKNRGRYTPIPPVYSGGHTGLGGLGGFYRW